jgi:rhamnulose-1-phosphate aldolase
MNHGLLLNEKVKAIVAEISDTARYFWEKGWAERNAGNISVNITDLLPRNPYIFDSCEVKQLSREMLLLGRNIFLLTATGIRMRDLASNPGKGLCMIQVDPHGNGYRLAESRANLLAGPKLLPTSELPTHLAIHEMLRQANPDTKVVIHAHVPEFIALSQIREFKSADAINRLLWSMHPETKMFVPRGVGFVPYVLPGTESIAAMTVKELESHSVVVWEKHGLIATGNSVTETFDTMDLLAQSAKIFFLCKNAGYNPEGLSDSQVREITPQS